MLTIMMIRSASLREFRAIPILRPSLARSQSTTHKSRQASRSTPSNQLVEEKVERRTSSAKKTERSSKGFGSIFSLPKPPDPKLEKQ